MFAPAESVKPEDVELLSRSKRVDRNESAEHEAETGIRAMSGIAYKPSKKRKHANGSTDSPEPWTDLAERATSTRLARA